MSQRDSYPRFPTTRVPDLHVTISKYVFFMLLIGRLVAGPQNPPTVEHQPAACVRPSLLFIAIGWPLAGCARSASRASRMRINTCVKKAGVTTPSPALSPAALAPRPDSGAASE